ncbi:MAG: choice-of-anchor D domain-containing protein, partial [Candidatus Eisenbacteria bacterium]|nr:choice-of-anchor D domain-containing protein [Candidatus Eisenbacteria bacterium]
TLQFGPLEVGETAEQSFTITNSGLGVLTGSVSEDCPHFSISAGAGPFELAPQESHLVTVIYEPEDSGQHACSIETGLSCPAVAASGSADLPPACAVEPELLDFGSISLGQSEERSFTITNAGGGLLAGFVSESCESFSIASGGGAFELAAQESREVTVVYGPADIGEHACTIETGLACPSVAASGAAGLPPECAVEPGQLDFGEIMAGQTSDRTFTITNIGAGQLTGRVEEACDVFNVISGGGDYSLGAGESRTVTVRYHPSAAGDHSCMVYTGSACDSVACTGTAGPGPECHLNPPELDFGEILIYPTSPQSYVDMQFVIANHGGGMVSGFVSPPSCPSYSIVSGGGTFNLGGGVERTVVVRFYPRQVGVFNCSIDTGSQCGEVALFGEGVPTENYGLEEDPGIGDEGTD